jgi:hypothetical protein
MSTVGGVGIARLAGNRTTAAPEENGINRLKTEFSLPAGQVKIAV